MLTYQLSPYLRRVIDSQGGGAFVYHALYGNPRLINDDGLQLLDLFKAPLTTAEAAAYCDEEPTDLIETLADVHFIIPPGLDERKLLHELRSSYLSAVSDGETVDRMGLAISDACNFGCTHCIHFQPLANGGSILPIYQKPVQQLNMTWETAKRCIDRYVSLIQEHGQSVGKIHFGNAEPLINWPVIAQALEYCSGISGMTFDFAINTNLVLLTKEIAQTLKRHHVRIATSLDGTAPANNAIRVTKGGRGTFDSIIAKFDLLESVGHPLDGFSVTVTNGNFDLVDTDIIDLAVARSMTSIAFDYDLVSLVEVPVEIKVDKLMRIKRYANEHAIDFFGTWDSPFRNLTSASLLTGEHAFCAAVQGKSLEFNVDGSIKVCSHTTTRIGHVDSFDDMFRPGGGLFRIVRERFPGTDDYCSGCAIEGPCGGQCHVTREVIARSVGEQRQRLFEAMCDFYRAVTNALAIEYIRLGCVETLTRRDCCTA